MPVPLSVRARRTALFSLLAMTPLFVYAAGSAPMGAAPANRDETAFLAENDTAMNTMMAGMAIKPSGDVDHDFVAAMVPHHQGAIDMAQAELRHGHNEQLRRIAQEIIVEQQQEIIAMHLALGQALPSPAPAPDQFGAPNSTRSPAAPIPHNSMQMAMPKESQ